jgi:hypothetical protein
MPVARSYLIDKRKLLKAPMFHYSATSGLITVIAAGTSSAGHLCAIRNPSTTKALHLARIRISFIPTVAFGAAQALVLGVYKLTAYSAAHSGGTAVTPAKRRTSQSDASVATMQIATTSALVTGTQTIAGQPLFRVGAHSTLPVIDAVWTPEDTHPEVLEASEGLLIRNEILMGASGVGQLSVEIDGWER